MNLSAVAARCDGCPGFSSNDRTEFSSTFPGDELPDFFGYAFRDEFIFGPPRVKGADVKIGPPRMRTLEEVFCDSSLWVFLWNRCTARAPSECGAAELGSSHRSPPPLGGHLGLPYTCPEQISSFPTRVERQDPVFYGICRR